LGKSYLDHSILWGKIPHASPETGSFWWKDVFRLVDYFRGHAMPWVGDGRTILLWHDVWNNISPRSTFPCLFSFAKKKDCSLQDFLANMDMERNFHTPLSPQAAHEYLAFHEMMSNLQNSAFAKDKWTYSWGNTTFSSSKFYSLTFQLIQLPVAFNWIWQSKLGKKFKIFVWLVFRDIINSKNILRRKNFLPLDINLDCDLCDMHCEETTYHLLFRCPFSIDCWSYVGLHWNHDLDFFPMIHEAKGAWS
jgi:hypothetical protein